MPPAPRPAGESTADALAKRAGRLEQIHESAQDKDWRGLHHLVEGEAGVRGLPAELRQGLEGLRTPARKLAALAGCRAALERPGAGLPTGLDELPEPLQRDFRELHALDDLGPALGKPWPKPPDVPAIQRDLAAVGEGDGKLALRLKLHLALKAEVEGHGEAARKLLPSPKELESAGPELRDLKAAAKSLTDAGEGQQGPPPAETLPPPEPPLAGTRPRVKESLREDLPRLTKEVDAEEARVRTRAREGIEKQSGPHVASLGRPLHALLDYARKEREKQEAGRTAAVSKQLGRALTASERILVRVMGRKGKKPAEMAAILPQLPPAPKRNAGPPPGRVRRADGSSPVRTADPTTDGSGLQTRTSSERRLDSLAPLVLLGAGESAVAQQALTASALWGALVARQAHPDQEWVPIIGSRRGGHPDDRVFLIGSPRRRQEYGGEVKCVACSPDGKWIASGGEDGLVRIWDADTLKAVAVLGGCQGVEALAFSPDGKRLAAGGQVIVNRWRPVEFYSTLELVRSGAWLRVWDVGGRSVIRRGRLRWESARFGLVRAVSFSPDGRTVGVVFTAATSNVDDWVQLVDLAGERPRARGALAGTGRAILSAAFSPNGRTLAVRGDSVIDLWDLGGEKGPEYLQRLPLSSPPEPAAQKGGPEKVPDQPRPSPQSGSPGADIGSRGGEQAAGGSRALRVGLAVSGALANLGVLALLAYCYAGRLWRGVCRLGAIRLGSDWWLDKVFIRSFMVLGGIVVLFLRLAEWGVLSPLGPDSRPEVLPSAPNVSPPVSPPVLLPRPSGWESVAFSPDGRRLAAGGTDGKVWLWDMSGPQPREEARLEGPRATGSGLVFAPDGRTLASVEEDGTARLWDLGSKIPRRKAALPGAGGPVWALAFSPDGRSLVAGGADGALRRWDLGGDTPRQKDACSERVCARSIAFSADGRALLLGCDDRSVRRWDLSGPEPRFLGLVKGLAEVPQELALSPDGKTLAVLHKDNSIRLWDLGGAVPREPAVLREPDGHKGSKVALQFSPDGKFLFAAGWKFCKLWDVRGPAPREVSPPSLGTSGGRIAAFSADSRLLAVGDGHDEWALLLDLADGRSRDPGIVRRGWGCVGCVFPDARTLLAIDGHMGVSLTVREWDLESGRLTRETPLEETEHDSFSGGQVAGARIIVALRRGVKSEYLAVWSRATGKDVGNYDLSGFALSSTSERPIRLAPDGRHLAAVLDDGTVYLLRLGVSGRQGPADYYRWGLFHAGRDEYYRAITAFSEAIRLDPNHARAYYHRGLAHAARDDYAQAKKDLDRAIELDPKLGEESAGSKPAAGDPAQGRPAESPKKER